MSLTHNAVAQRTSLDGPSAEQLAHRYLVQRGLRLVVRNFRSKMGELDLVMQEGETLVFVEVRYRRSNRFGGAAASIDPRKQLKLMRTAQLFLQQHYGNNPPPCRFDVVSVGGTAEQPQIDWIANALQNFA